MFQPLIEIERESSEVIVVTYISKELPWGSTEKQIMRLHRRDDALKICSMIMQAVQSDESQEQ